MFTAKDAREQSAQSKQQKINKQLQEFEGLIEQAAKRGERKVTTEEFLCYTKDECNFFKEVGDVLVRNGYDVAMGTEVGGSYYLVTLYITW